VVAQALATFPPRHALCSPELDLVVSGAADGTLLLHTLSGGAYVRSFRLPHGVPPALLCIAPKPGEQLVLVALRSCGASHLNWLRARCMLY